MPAAARLGDPTTGHGAFSPRSSAATGSTDVFINGRGAVRVGDSWPEHSDGNSSHEHDPLSKQTTGSPTVFVNGQPLARIGDSISCGDAVAAGSEDVISG